MAEPLAVDPARLIAAGSKLAELVFPTAPAPISVAGSDPVSAAINETMPGIESLVSDGLPGVTAALKRTATSMATAADIYAKADQSLGEALTQSQFGATAQTLQTNGVAGAAAGVTGQSAGLLGAPMGAAAAAGGTVGAAVGAQADALAPRVAATVPQMVQLAPQAGQWAQQASPIAQTVSQTAQQAGSQGGSQGAAPAQLASDTKPQDEDTKKDDEEEHIGGDEAAGSAEAAEGARLIGSVPLASPAGSDPTSLAAPL
ncbi:ESX-1 secretion-associated protein EspJ [Mycobacterium kubicae]|uniref:ESX-1 secretion-associated protein EspJ n=1 Tax=Mycobacterium kubicae TaxID=120959 RepID=A0AAX1JC47_9MYCO|nr:hypothetical protein [Mycobacterium kubicae]MCV7094881.1 hypothetical protein [Mycobacterium kubicae]OBF23138.1 hypothetical protein A5725_09170 [Mycobacterium kubicae]ORW02815.1 hypothetical protein AWC13_03765 [Mycobacterium kubicae]QNI14470.1 hypothetical protein GAN18_28355 [Mycobacterium kubicae]QPI37994.1 hypothetical protein I2456_27815 [Mycobacterium kubicae]